MSAQLSVVIAYYSNLERCSAALRSLGLLSSSVNVLDGLILFQEEAGGQLKVAERSSAESSRTIGRSLDEVFPPRVLALGSPGAKTDDATAHFLDQGLDVNLVREVGENLPPGGAALVTLIEEGWLRDLSVRLGSYSDLERFVMRPGEGSTLRAEEGQRDFSGVRDDVEEGVSSDS
jgi:hypothetical protein